MQEQKAVLKPVINMVVIFIIFDIHGVKIVWNGWVKQFILYGMVDIAKFVGVWVNAMVWLVGVSVLGNPDIIIKLCQINVDFVNNVYG